MPHPFGELAIPSIEVGFENSYDLWDRNAPSNPQWNDMLGEPSPSPYTMTPATTPPAESPVSSSAKASSKQSPKQSSRAVSNSGESEEDRRKSRKREQNRESQRNFRRRQENRVKFLESRTMELEANSRQLRAENARLKTELNHANQRHDELFSMMSMPNTPMSLPLDFEEDLKPSNYTSHPGLSMPMQFDLNEQHFYAPPAVLQDPSHVGAW